MPGVTCTSADVPACVIVEGMSTMMAAQLLVVGIALMVSPLSVVWRRVLCTSTMGVSPLTVIVSSTAPTFMSALTVAVNDPVSSMPSRFTDEKPVSVNVTEYVPGRRSTMRYWPEPSVTAVRVFSIRTGLATSTVTPGSTAPDMSLAVPVIDALTPCARAPAGRHTANASTPINLATRPMKRPPFTLVPNPCAARRAHTLLPD